MTANANDRPPPHIAIAAEQVRTWLESREPAVPKSVDEIAKMSPAERIDYCRRFDQSKLPAWRDPRVA